MLSKRYKSTEVDCRTWLHVPSGTELDSVYCLKYTYTAELSCKLHLFIQSKTTAAELDSVCCLGFL